MIQLSKWYRSIFKDEPTYKKPKSADANEALIKSIFRRPKITTLPDFSGIKHLDEPPIKITGMLANFNRKKK